MDANDVGHVPVLLNEVLEFLDLDQGQAPLRVLDCTLGRGGHAAHIIPRLAPGSAYIGLDLDPGNLDYARQRLDPIAASAGVTLHTVHQSFASLENALQSIEIESVDRVLADLGFASNQVDDPERGLSFRSEGPLDMRLDPTGPQTAADLVSRLSEGDLADVIFQYGEERLSRRIARKICQVRVEQPISTTSQLAEICRRAYGSKGGSRIDPATRTFQALRIAVNGELDALETLLKRLPNQVAQDGVIGIISFHSLEDRLVKRAFLAAQQQGELERVTRKPITANEQEQQDNPRSRSAKFRVAKRTQSGKQDDPNNPAAPPQH